MAGLMLRPGDRGREITELCRDVLEDGPEELAGGALYLTGPPEEFVPAEMQGALCCGLALVWAGESSGDGEPYARRFRKLEPAVDLVGPMPYADFQCMIDDPPGLRNYWTADYLDELSDEAIDVFVEHSNRMPVPSACQSILFPWGGAVARVDSDSTPMAKRDAKWVSHPFVLWEDAADDERHFAWGRAISADLKRFTTGLAQIKAEYDPENVFRFNQNIKPAPAVVA